jgi:cytochrome c-type biogenesis protein CcmH
MLLPLALALVTAAVLVVVIGPLLKEARATPTRAEFDRAVYRDQLKELERDHARGLIGAAEAKTARLEIERRILASDRDAVPAPGANARPLPLVAGALALVLAGGAGAVYLALGAPGVPDLPFAARSGGPPPDLAATIADLRQRVAATPRDIEGWLLLARTEAEQQDWQNSADAYRHARALAPGRADIEAAYGEVLVMGADGIVTPTAHEVFAGLVAKDQGDAVARYYLALADAQAGKTDAAIAAWQKLAAEAPADAPIRATLARRIADAAQSAGIAPPSLAPPAAPVSAAAAPGPDAAAVAAAARLAPDQRAAMVKGMVAKLAAQLQAAPDDRAGWLRLARAYGVMGERDKAADAYDQAAALDPENADIPRQEVDALVAGQGLEAPLSPRVIALLHRMETLAPNDPEALWYLGLAAAQAHQPDAAQRYWQRLLASLPAAAPERKTVSAALDALKGK